MNKYTILIILTLGYLVSNSQALTPEVSASSGAYMEKGGYSLSWTLGEPVSESFTRGNEQFTQGFQQSFLYHVTDISDPIREKDYTIEIFPNPAELFFFVQFDPEQKRPPLKLHLFNSTGSQLYETKIDPDTHQYRINISKFPSDMFLMMISDEGKSFIRSFKIIKY